MAGDGFAGYFFALGTNASLVYNGFTILSRHDKIKLEMKRSDGMAGEKKARMAEPDGEANHQLQDKGYKKLFENKEMFLEFLQTFVKEDWVKDINEDDLVRVNKEYVLQDYRKKEADVVYRMKFRSSATGEEKDVIFYILLELQSGVDRMMPYRLLMYMVQIWKQELTNVKYDDAQDQGYKLPAIVPIVLYNGAKEWDAVMRFRDLQNASDRFGDHLVDFQYILVNVNGYNEGDLLRVANAISCIIMMDQTIVAKDKGVMIRRLNEMVQRKDKLAPEKMELILEWLMEVFNKRFPKAETKKIIESLREGKDMTYAIERLFDSIEEKGMEKGIKMIVMMQLLHRFHDLPEEYKRRIEQLSEQKFEQIAKDIFTIEKVEDLDKYLQ